ncbi:hypothetical protein AB0L05_26095 [Nonomuraea pusilla]|uniref:hypothetical protein n=1 Tax=Nonomuraea pusilla TaxID=46177 RepID=UPI00332CE55D
MSHPKSGLLRGLVTGLVAGVPLGAAGLVGFIHLVWPALPDDVVDLGDGLPFQCTTALIAGLLVAVPMLLVRPRSLMLPWAAACFGLAALLLGVIVVDAATVLSRNGGRTPLDFDLDRLRARLPGAARALWSSPPTDWRGWLFLGVAALAPFLLVLLRALRLRAKARAAAADTTTGSAAEEAPAGQEPEYRAPFEPAQAPVQQPTADLFTPRRPAGD